MEQNNRDLLAGMYVSIISTYVLWKLHLEETMSFSETLSGVFTGLSVSTDVEEFVKGVILQLEEEESPLEALTYDQRLLVFTTLNSVMDAVKNPNGKATSVEDSFEDDGPFEDFGSQSSNVPFDTEDPFDSLSKEKVDNMSDTELKNSIKGLFE